MAGILDWLSRLMKLSVDHKKFDDEQCSSSDGLQERSNSAEFEAAYQRMRYLMDVGLEIHVALVSQRCLATGAEAVALQELIDQHKAIFKEISKHKCALLLAYDSGCDIDFDAKFWRNHSTLLHHLPEVMRPASTVAEDFITCKDSTTGIRKREHWHSAPVAI